jgi:hypothetical protein
MEVGRLTNEELEVVLVLTVGTPACADIALLGLQSLEHGLESIFPLLLSTLDGEDEAFSNWRHCT